MEKLNKMRFFQTLCCLTLFGLMGAACSGGKSPGNMAGSTPISDQANGHRATEGGVDGGGGNYVGSEVTQIKAIFHGDKGFDLKSTVKDVFKIIELQVRNKFVAPDLESIFSRMLGPKFSGDQFDIYQDIEKSPYELKEKSCLEDPAQGFKDAGTKLDKKESPICFSIDGLKKLPIQAIPFQLVALAVHEHAHHYGFDEADAIKAQKHVLETMNRGILNGIYMETIGAAADVRDHATRLLDTLAASYTDKLLCKHLSTIDETASTLVDLSVKIEHQFELRMLSTALGHELAFDKNSLSGVNELKDLTRGMLSYCGDDPLVDPTWVKRVDEGDRSKLQASLLMAKSLAHQIVTQTIEFSRQKRQ